MASTAIKQTDRFGSVGKYILTHDYSKDEIDCISARYCGYLRELKLQILSLNGPWQFWKPDIRLNGTGHLDAALKHGHGAILWVTESVFSTLIVKMALHEAGYQASQLSRPGHGFSQSGFGVRFLNPLWTRVEDRFIAERVLIMGGIEASAANEVRILRERLAANHVVIITVSPAAHKFAEVPFLYGRLNVPTGPIRLAMASGADLLPVFAFTKDSGEFEVSIQEPLNPTDEQNDNESIAAAYAKRLESFVREHPDQWTGWHKAKTDGADWLRQDATTRLNERRSREHPEAE
jgi:hypothetical protein